MCANHGVDFIALRGEPAPRAVDLALHSAAARVVGKELEIRPRVVAPTAPDEAHRDASRFPNSPGSRRLAARQCAIAASWRPSSIAITAERSVRARDIRIQRERVPRTLSRAALRSPAMRCTVPVRRGASRSTDPAARARASSGERLRSACCAPGERERHEHLRIRAPAGPRRAAAARRLRRDVRRPSSMRRAATATSGSDGLSVNARSQRVDRRGQVSGFAFEVRELQERDSHARLFSGEGTRPARAPDDLPIRYRSTTCCSFASNAMRSSDRPLPCDRAPAPAECPSGSTS